MLTFVNKCWKFKTEEELNKFLNSCISSDDDYQITNHGISSKGEWFAFGNVIAHTKFGVKAQQVQEQAVASELNLG